MRRHPYLSARIAGTAAVAACALLTSPLAAIDGDLDDSFHGDGRFVHDVPSFGGRAAAVAPDGRLLIGYTAVLSGTDRDMRILPVPDSGATTHCGVFHPDLGGTDDDRLTDIAVAGDDVLLVGRADGPAADPDPRLALAKTDIATCQLNPDFGGADGVVFDLTSPVEGIAVAVDWFGTAHVAAMQGEVGNRVLRAMDFTALGVVDGTEVVSFATAFDAESYEPKGIFVQPDGRRIVVGTMVLPDGDRDVGVAVFEADGDLDPTFSIDGLVGFSYDIIDSGFDEGYGVVSFPDGRIVVVGSVQRPGGHDAAVAILTPTGGFFNDFGLIGRYSFDVLGGDRTEVLRSVALQGDGKIVAAGSSFPPAPSTDVDFAVARLLSSGDEPLDPEFVGGGKRAVFFDEGGGLTDQGYDVTLGQGGRITVVGSVATDNGTAIGAARLENDYIYVDGFEWGQLFGTEWKGAFGGGIE